MTALVALPVLAMAMIAVLARTGELTADERADRFLGTTDALVQVTSSGAIEPPDVRFYADGGGGWIPLDDTAERDPLAVDVSALLPPGTSLSRLPGEDLTTVESDGRLVQTSLLVDALDSRLAPSRYGLDSGQAPAAPDEVAVSEALAAHLGLALGDSLQVGEERTVTVTGIAVDADCLACRTVYAEAGLGADLVNAENLTWTATRWLVDLPATADPAALWRSLAAEGVVFLPRDGILHPDRYQTALAQATGASLDTLAAIGLVVGFGLLEVVLLAGTAFAVGARRQVRELGLLAANGGDRRDIRRVVLAQGIVLGGLGGLVGLALGFVPVLVGWSAWERSADHAFAGLVVVPSDLALIGGFGVLAGLLAAIVPAMSASRVPVLAALSERTPVPERPMRAPLAGIALLATGAAVAFLAAARARALDARYERALAGVDLTAGAPLMDPPATRLYIALSLLGFAAMALGLLLAAPALVGAVGRLARWFPLVARLALRDAGRHRHRTAPAICAVVMAVAGTVAIGYVISADDAASRDSYELVLPLGATFVQPDDRNPARYDAAVRSASQVLGGGAPVTVTYAGLSATGAEAPDFVPAGETYFEQVAVAAVCPDVTACEAGVARGALVVGGVDLAEALLGRALSVDELETYESGGALVFDNGRQMLEDGEIRLGTYASLVPPGSVADVDVTGAGGTAGPDDEVFGADFHATLVAVAVQTPVFGVIGAALVSPTTAAGLGLDADLGGTLIPASSVPSAGAEERALAGLADAGLYADVERGYESSSGLYVLLLGAASGLVTVAGVAIAVGLAGAESRADLATLAAVGADPRRRRSLAMAQASVVGVLGAIVGVGFGTYVALIALEGFGLAPWMVPWPLLAVIGVGVPLVAVLVSGLFTRSRLPVVRRMAA